MSDFKIGDTVRLKSGGPLMTVERLGKNYEQKPTIECVWFMKEAEKRGAFPPDALKLSDDSIGLA